ncbi:MAG TPA: TIGR02996 domain-containing protein [Gemmataceae bacterium]|nr:TIGR02996 domain-containing protein [Gemmataceae bacterium]
MTDEQALLAAICGQPEEDTPRLAFADWLDEQGGEANSARAEFVHLQVEAAALGRTPHPDMAKPAEVDDLTGRADALRKEFLPAWSAGWPPVLARDPAFTRGFVEHVHASGDEVRNELAVARRFEPITGVTLEDEPESFPSFDHPVFMGIRSLGVSVRWWRSAAQRERVASVFRGLADGERLGGVTDLALLSPVDEQAADSLTRAVSLRNVRRLTFRSIAWTAFAALADAPLFDTLEELVLDPDPPRTDRRGNWISPGRAPDLRGVVGSSRLGRLRVLRVRNARPLAVEVHALVNSDRLPALTTLDLSRCPIGNDGVRYLATAPLIGRLSDLNLTATRVSGLGALAVASSPAGNLRALNLSMNLIRNDGAQALARSPHLRNLRFLALNWCGLSAAGGRALAEAPVLGELEELQLEGNPGLGKAAVARLRERFGDRVWFGADG